MAILRMPQCGDNPHWRKPNYATDREAIWAAYHKRQRKLLNFTQTKEALLRKEQQIIESDLPPFFPIKSPEPKLEIDNE